MSDNLIVVTANLQKQIGIKFKEVGNLYIQIAETKNKYAKTHPGGVTPKQNFGKKNKGTHVKMYF